MIFFGLLYLIGIAVLITFIFTKLLRVRGPWGSFWTFFSIILLAVLASDLWIAPVGPYYGDIYWLPPLVVGIIIAFLLAATSPPKKRSTELEEPFYQVVEDHPGAIALGAFFWFLLILMLLLVVAGFLSNVTT